MTKSEQATKLWAADRLGINPATIERVGFDETVEYSGGCETCEYEYVGKRAEVSIEGSKYREIDLTGVTFQSLIAEIGEFVQ